MAEIGIIGGTGVYDQDVFSGAREVEVDTPFGKPSGPLMVGEYEGKTVAFLPRHGKGHVFSPTTLNYRANIFALKKLGVEYIISVAAVGSLKKEIKPLDIVIPSQIYDKTKLRENTFFEDIVVHIGFADPFCPNLSRLIEEVIKEKKFRYHSGGTYVCIEGPQFSTRAESEVHRKLGFDIIGMTAIPEAKLAREAEICYATIATVTDYDVWYGEEVDVEMVLENAKKNEEKVREILKTAIPEIGGERSCGCQDALRFAITTAREYISEEGRKKLGLLIEKYL